jgi:NAD(P) transhydrogenase
MRCPQVAGKRSSELVLSVRVVVIMWYDLLIVGNDPAGVQAALTAARAGLSVGVVWPAGDAPATTAQTIDALDELTERIVARTGRPTIAACRAEFRKIIARERDLAARLLQRCGVDLIVGDWRWISDRRVEVATESGLQTIEGERVLVATGDTFRRPAWMLGQEELAQTPDRLFERSAWPQTAVIAGAGRAGTIVARLLATVGVRVTLVDRKSAGLSLPPVQTWDDARLGRWAVGLTRTKADDAGLVLHDGMVVAADAVVVAVGSEAAPAGRNFVRLGARTDTRGRLWCGSNFETTVPGLFAAGAIVAEPTTGTGYETAVALLRTEFPAVANQQLPRRPQPTATTQVAPRASVSAARAVPAGWRVIG